MGNDIASSAELQFTTGHPQSSCGVKCSFLMGNVVVMNRIASSAELHYILGHVHFLGFIYLLFKGTTIQWL